MFGKSVISLAVALLAATSLVSAQPHRRRHAGLHARRAVPDGVSTAAHTVWVDQYGKAVDPNAAQKTVTVTVDAPAVTTTIAQKKPCTTSAVAEGNEVPVPSKQPEYSAPAPVSSPTKVSAPPAAPTTTSKDEAAPAPTTTSKAAPPPETTTKAAPTTTSATKKPATSAAPTTASSSAAPKPTGGSSGSYTVGTYPAPGGNKPGIVYTPKNDDGSCKKAEDIKADIRKLEGFSPIRLYGIECKQIENVIAAAKPLGMKVFTGIYDVDKAETELEALITAVDGEWDTVHTVAIGNEVVNFGKKSATEFASIINTSRARVRKAGYNGPVVGVDTFVAIMKNPAICEASDYIAANCHSFFDGNIKAEGTGQFLNDMKDAIRKSEVDGVKRCDKKDIVITEVGWPWRGGIKGEAVPSVENQKVAIKSIVETQQNNVILFTAFDEGWKKDTPETLGTEKFWGINDLSAIA